jgi:hypothetical protein
MVAAELGCGRSQGKAGIVAGMAVLSRTKAAAARNSREKRETAFDG